MSLFGSNYDEVWVKGTDDTWVTDSRTVLTLRADGTYTKEFSARVGAGIGVASFVSGPNVHSGTYKRSGSLVHLSGDGRYSPYTEDLSLFRKVSSVSSAPTPRVSTTPQSIPTIPQHKLSSFGRFFNMAIEAAPTIIQILEQEAEARNPILAPGEPPLRQSHASDFARAITRATGTDLTLDEDETLPVLLKQLWSSQETTEARNAVIKIATLSEASSLATVQWQESAVALFGELTRCLGAEHLIQWLRGVQIRVEYHPGAPSSTVRRQEFASAKAAVDNLKATEEKIVSLRKGNEQLHLETKTLHEKLEQLKQVCLSDKEQLSKLIENVPGSVEGKLRHLFVKERGSWRDLLITPNVSEKKLTNSRRVHNIPQTEKIIALIDLTLFGSAKDAVVFSTSGVYFKTGNTPYSIQYGQLNSYNFRSAQNGIFVSGGNRSGEFEIHKAYMERSAWKVLEAVQRMFRQ